MQYISCNQLPAFILNTDYADVVVMLQHCTCEQTGRKAVISAPFTVYCSSNTQNDFCGFSELLNTTPKSFLIKLYSTTYGFLYLALVPYFRTSGRYKMLHFHYG
jgi:hypothetical protein